MADTNKMKVEIWSDIMCPFCYIGKRKFEHALQQFDNSTAIEIEWHSFQLDPNMQFVPGRDIHTYLAELKGQTTEWSRQMHRQLTDTAKAVGLSYNFDKAVIANSFDAHRLIQMAKQYGKGDAAEERLFRAYFTEGKNISDHETLVALGEEIGLDKNEVEEVLAGNAYADKVNADIREAQQLGVTSVPFFVFDRKYAVAGAQSPATFLQVLERAFGEWQQTHKPLVVEGGEGDACDVNGNCA